MSQLSISIENLSKVYRLGQIGTGTLSYDLKVWWAKVSGQPNPMVKIGQDHINAHNNDTIWALRDVNYQIPQGMALGIIGRNGAGKSTLLKVLSRVTAPTSGKVKVRGRIASLLEVGTGFHPELTGRENIYLNGAILGMSKDEVRRKFNEIVEFAEIEQFVDTPVKRYSSGMYVRLAFAVAAHLDPEILLVDEVLAVGDIEFQKKCLGKMGDVTKEGRTILFVSHNMQAILGLTRQAIHIEKGQIVDSGDTAEVVDRYFASMKRFIQGGFVDLSTVKKDGGDQTIRFTSICLRNKDNEVTSKFSPGEAIFLEIGFESDLRADALEIGFAVKIMEGAYLFVSSSSERSKFFPVKKGKYKVQTCISPNHLNPGNYFITLGTTYKVLRVFINEAIQFEIIDSRRSNDSILYRNPGYMNFDFIWSDAREEE